MTTKLWTIRVTSTARTDFRRAVAWSRQNFGPLQARVYSATLKDAIEALEDGPAITGVRRRDDIREGVFTLHVARSGHKGRHLIVFRVASETRHRIDVLRILHDAMELSRRMQ